MKEDLLHYAWRLKKFVVHQLKTTDGQDIIIHQFGHLNYDAGPDFLHARITIGDTEWAGNIEMHLKSSDWIKHKHSDDAAYDNVILHVVYEEDVPILRKTGKKISCLVMKERIPQQVRSQYQRLLQNEQSIPCENLLHQVPPFTWKLWLERLSIERLEEKVKPIETAMERLGHDREEVFYQFLSKNFGVKVNAEPFEQLARSLPQNILSKYRNNLFQIEALLFGQAGMLEKDFIDDYPQRLKKEYGFLAQKHQLNPIIVTSWKFLRLRPANFPTVRLAQFAALVHRSNRLFSQILWMRDMQQLRNLFEVEISDYWKTHYVFDKASKHRVKRIGKSTLHLITINTIIPFLFQYGQEKQEESLKEKALSLLMELKAENNTITHMWKELGIDAENAAQSQALLQLKKQYCQAKKCLNCMVGCAIMGKQVVVT